MAPPVIRLSNFPLVDSHNHDLSLTLKDTICTHDDQQLTELADPNDIDLLSFDPSVPPDLQTLYRVWAWLNIYCPPDLRMGLSAQFLKLNNGLHEFRIIDSRKQKIIFPINTHNRVAPTLIENARTILYKLRHTEFQNKIHYVLHCRGSVCKALMRTEYIYKYFDPLNNQPRNKNRIIRIIKNIAPTVSAIPVIMMVIVLII